MRSKFNLDIKIITAYIEDKLVVSTDFYLLEAHTKNNETEYI